MNLPSKRSRQDPNILYAQIKRLRGGVSDGLFGNLSREGIHQIARKRQPRVRQARFCLPRGSRVGEVRQMREC